MTRVRCILFVLNNRRRVFKRRICYDVLIRIFVFALRIRNGGTVYRKMESVGDREVCSSTRVSMISEIRVLLITQRHVYGNAWKNTSLSTVDRVHVHTCLERMRRPCTVLIFNVILALKTERFAARTIVLDNIDDDTTIAEQIHRNGWHGELGRPTRIMYQSGKLDCQTARQPARFVPQYTYI